MKFAFPVRFIQAKEPSVRCTPDIPRPILNEFVDEGSLWCWGERIRLKRRCAGFRCSFGSESIEPVSIGCEPETAGSVFDHTPGERKERVISRKVILEFIPIKTAETAGRHQP